MSIPSLEPVRKFVRAGAGAGKTWNLTRQVVELAMNHRQQHGQWPKTVLTTFTRKATQELKERMLLYCLEEKPQALEFVQSTSFLQITTMHGLLSRFLSQHGHAIGFPNQLKVVDKKQADFWRKQILRNMIPEFKNSKSLQHFDINKILSHLSDFESVYWSNQVKPLSQEEDFQKVMDLLLSQLATLLEEQMTEAQSQDPGEKWEEYFTHLKTLHGILLEPKAWAQWRDQLAAFYPLPRRPNASKTNPGLDKTIKTQMDKTLADIKKFAIDPEFSSEFWLKTMEVLKDFQNFAHRFMEELIQKKKEEGAVEPNDLEFFSLKILQEKPHIIEQFSKEIDAWFIDEFQDTSPLQMELLEPMIGERSCYIVGDPQQSIYLFRGSRSEVFLSKAQRMESQGAEILHLQKNYRSQAALLDFFNQLFPSVNEQFSPMEAAVESIDDAKAVEIAHNLTGDVEGEFFHLTTQLNDLIETGVSPKDICILTKTHAHTDHLQKQLMGLGYPVISHSSSNFYKRREIIDGLSLLKFLINPWDDKNLLILLRSPWLAVSDQDIVGMIGDAKKNFWPGVRDEFIKMPDSSPQHILLESLKTVKQSGYAWAFRKLIIKLGLIDQSFALDSTGRREANLWKLINIVEKNAREPGASLIQLVTQGIRSSSLEDFGDAGDANSPVEPNKIHLMTVHASKGLQYDHVFLPFLHKKPNDTKFKDFTFNQDLNMWSMRMPLSDATKHQGGALESLYVRGMRGRESEESLRVLYVGMTRAKKKLYLSWSGKPESHSWAEILTERQSQWNSMDAVEFVEITESAGVAFAGASVSSQPRTPFAKEVVRFSSGELTESDELQKGSWTSLKTSHEKRRQGVVLHKVFECLKTQSIPQVKELAKVWLPGQESSIAEAIDFLTSSDEVPLMKIIEQGYAEWGYALLVDGKKMERRIDLWGLVDEKLWIVDYKTGSTDFKDKAFLQMSEYAKTLCAHLHWEGVVELAAVYPFSKKVFTLKYQ